ncbi:MAG: hypothetical protein OSP8Acid_01650 [uncultured Acidilobus sp. OSP8]|nr:MAG: hypothetical protein OSP8Acid_01650 [uncultured Acidilobus sp. OSP8]
MSRDLYLIFMAKGLRTFVFGLVSVLPSAWRPSATPRST